MKTLNSSSVSMTSTDKIHEDRMLSTTEKLLKLRLQMQKSSSDLKETNISSEHTSQSVDIDEAPLDKISQIRKNILGFNTRYISPLKFELQSVYVDHTATNRPYKTVERMIDYAKKFSANPHTEFSHFGKYSTKMMHYAQESLLRSFGTTSESYVALPTGSGCTGAIQKCIKILKSIQHFFTSAPTVFMTGYEHHSNILPWVEYYTGSEDTEEGPVSSRIQILASNNEGDLNLPQIERQLKQWPNDNIIVTISASSNVTSMLTDLDTFNKIIKRVRQTKNKNIYFCVDCAAYSCHKMLDLSINSQIDFVFLSPHKNLGGAEACGVLIAKNSAIQLSKPTFPGGGTVAFVKGYTKSDIIYSDMIFDREIAGTPPFFGFYRAALSFQLLKDHIGYDFIHEREAKNTLNFVKLINRANEEFKAQKIPKAIVIYGSRDFEKRANVITLNIISKNTIAPHNFISLLLADLFGIQVRSGCFCAGPYGLKLLSLDKEIAKSLEDQVSVGVLKNKPGYLRLDMTFYLQNYEVEYIANCIIQIANYYEQMENIYTLCNDGEIQRHKMFKDSSFEMYSLSTCKKVNQILQFITRTDKQRLRDRRATLKHQFQRGVKILQNQMQFLKEKSQESHLGNSSFDQKQTKK